MTPSRAKADIGDRTFGAWSYENSSMLGNSRPIHRYGYCRCNNVCCTEDVVWSTRDDEVNNTSGTGYGSPQRPNM